IGRKPRPALKCRVLDVWPIDKNSACADKCIAPTSLACTAPGWGIGGPALAHDSDACVLRLCGPLPCRVLSKKRAYQDGEIRPKRSVRCRGWAIGILLWSRRAVRIDSRRPVGAIFEHVSV